MDPKTSTSIKVAIRIRPLIALENEKNLKPQWNTQQNVIYQIDDSGQKFGEAYSFDHIFGMNQTNCQIYNEIVQDFVGSSLNGLNSTIFAYGQTSSGKTYTMLGHKQDAGIMSLAIENIFSSIENNITRKYLLRVSYIEIYNEKINDLLDPSNKDMKIREFFPTGVGLQNVKEELVSTKEEMYSCLKTGNLHRHIGSTKANERSSRSHTIFKITIESTLCSLDSSSGCVQVSSLNLVDLAGSERVAQTKATGMRLKEGGHINKSLSALSLVIKQLSDGNEFVNFRDSKLTRLLQDSLGGNSKTLVIATITVASLEDTGSTLAFAQRAKTVKNKPQVNEILTDADVSKRYAAMNTQLQKKLEEQLLVNQKLQKTQVENNWEMQKLQQQMQMLEDFQFGTHIQVSKNKVPKRRHTIGFSGQKQRFLNTSSLDSFDHCSESMEDFSHLSDLTAITKDCQSSMNTLETIMEEELATPRTGRRTQSSTSDTFLTTPLSVVDEDHELTVFRHDESGDEASRKVVELGMELEKSQLNLLAAEEEWRSRERELCGRINELEDNLLENRPKDDLADDIMDQLICLQDILTNPDFMNSTLEVKQEDSALEIIEKFNAKVRTSKDIIENEILKQINSPNGLQEPIRVPNELASFNDLLSELSSFEDIPVDLISNMKKESVKDFKILIKVYESLLRKNDLIKVCSEKIRMLEEEQRRKKISHEEIKSHKSEINKLITECERKSICQFELEERCITFEEETEKLRKQLSETLEKNNSLKCSDSDDLQSQIATLASEIKEKNDLISRLEQDIEDSGKMSKCLQCELQNARTDAKMEEMDSLQSQIDELTSTINDKDVLILSLETNFANFKDAKETLTIEYDEILNENRSLKREMEEKNVTISEVMAQCKKLIRGAEEYCQKMDAFAFETVEKLDGLECKNGLILEENVSLKSKLENAVIENGNNNDLIAENQRLQKDLEELKLVEEESDGLRFKIDVLNLEINGKDTLMSTMEADSLKSQEEMDHLKLESCKILEENNSLRSELENLKAEIEIKMTQNENLDAAIAENQRLQHDLENLKRDSGESRQKIDGFSSKVDALNSEISAKNILMSKLESSSFEIQQELDIMKMENCNILEENKSLKCELEKMKAEVEIKMTQNQNLNETVIENKRLQNDLENVKRLSEEYRHKIDDLLSKIDSLNSGIGEKNILISALESSSIEFQHGIDNLKDANFNILEENKSLKCELEKLEAEIQTKVAQNQNLNETITENKRLQNDLENVKRLSDEYRHKIDDLLSKLDSLNSEIGEKNILISALESRSVEFQHGIDNLKDENFNILKENKFLKCEFEKLEAEIETKVAQNQNLTETIAENKRLQNDLENVKRVSEAHRHKIAGLLSKIDSLNAQINEKNILISTLKRNSLNSKQEVNNLKLENYNILEENKFLKCELEKTKAEIETKTTQNQKLHEAMTEIKKYRQKIDSLLSKITSLESEVSEKNISISGLESSCLKLKQEVDNLKLENRKILNENKSLQSNLNNAVKMTQNPKLNEVIAENKRLQNDLENMKRTNEGYRQKIDNFSSKVDALNSEISAKNALISNLEATSMNVKEEKENLNHEYVKVLEENKHLKCGGNNLNEHKTSPNELIVQRHKQLYKSAQIQINDLKEKLTDYEKIKRTISTYKVQTFENNRKLEEYRQLNVKLQAEIYEAKNVQVQSKGCDEDCSFRSNFKEQESFVNELVATKEKLELILCSIIEDFLSEQKALASVRHSQKQRDYFKNVLRDLKATNTVSKHHLSLLRNHDKYEFDEIRENLLKCRAALQEYFTIEKSLMQKEICQLDDSNKDYLQEMIALKNQTECIYCSSLKRELAKLKELHSRQEQTLSSVKTRNELLEKEHAERMQQITNLQVQLYSEQDKKAELQYNDYVKFLKDNDKVQQQQIQKLERKNEEYRKMAEQNKSSSEEEAQKKENYNLMKAKCIKRGQEVAALKSEILRLKTMGNQET